MNTRDAILDAAAAVMRERGLARATTKEIARAAGYSEATLYKHFDDKQEIFLSVLKERMPSFSSPLELVGAATVRINVAAIVEQLMKFYVLTFPIAASIFGSPELLATQRDGIRARNVGPEGPVHAVRVYLDGEVESGRLPTNLNTDAVAKLLTGAAMQQAFLATFNALDAVPHARSLARALADAALPADLP
jgi:AcrR family transcriptional regulator